LVAHGKAVGSLTDIRQGATVTACLNDGYHVVGKVLAVDSDTSEGLALVIGVR
jgi:hypothetical protein